MATPAHKIDRYSGVVILPYAGHICYTFAYYQMIYHIKIGDVFDSKSLGNISDSVLSLGIMEGCSFPLPFG